MKYRILSLDGGGIRGLVSVILLKRLSCMPGLEKLLESIDYVAGTSTGGLLALGIARGLGLDEMKKLYVDQGPVIFKDSLWDNVKDLGKLRGADYTMTHLHDELEKILGKTTLGELKKKVVVTSFKLDNEDSQRRSWEPKLFHNFDGPENDADELACKVGQYTSATPVFFPVVDGYIDGGVYAPNPAMCAVSQIQDKSNKPSPRLKRLVLLSLGTGTSLQYIPRKNLDWGVIQWAKPLLKLFLEGNTGVVDLQCTQLLGKRYHRLSPVFPPGVNIGMDDIKSIPYLIEFAEKVDLSATAEWIKEVWKPRR